MPNGKCKLCDFLTTKKMNEMEKPNYDCIAYDSGNELEDLKQYKIDVDKYTTSVEVELEKLKTELKNHEDLHDVRLSSLVDDWLDRQIEYEKIASEKEDARHAAKFNGKSQATRDCWKELQRVIKNEA